MLTALLVPLLVGLGFIAAGVFVVVRASTAPRLVVALLRTRIGRVSDLMSTPPDRICLVGTIEAGTEGTIQAPFSGRECVALDFEVQELETTHNAATNTNSSSWEPIHGGTTDRPFVLTDKSGKVRVRPAGAHYSLGVDTRIDVDGGERPPERIQRYIEVSDAVDSEETSLKVGPFDFNTGEDRRYVERRLEPGDRVLVLGRPVRARGDVGMVNAEIRPLEEVPMLLADAGRKATIGRLLVGSVLVLGLGLALVTIGLVALFFGLQSALGGFGGPVF